MEAIIYLINGNALKLDEYATKLILKSIHEKELTYSLVNLNISDITGKIKYTIPMSNILYIEYID